MAEELQSLIEKINRDGIEKAAAEAAKIVSAAKDEAAEIVKSAKDEAAKFAADAKADAEAVAMPQPVVNPSPCHQQGGHYNDPGEG